MIKKILTLVCFGLLGASAAMAVPAKPTIRTHVQPDGSTIDYRVVGDEQFHCCITEDGYLIEAMNDGYFYFIGNDAKVSQIRATNAEQRTSAAKSALSQIDSKQVFDKLHNQQISLNAPKFKALKAGAAPMRVEGPNWDNADGHNIRKFPCFGEKNVLIILVNFKDQKFSYCENVKEEMSKMFNEPGYTTFDCTGSAIDYFTTCSDGQFTPKFDIVGPIELDYDSKYYGQNVDGFDAHPNEMVAEACQKADNLVDFSKYDTDGDKYVDNVYVIYAGLGESDTPQTPSYSNLIWPHSSTLEDWGTFVTLDGVKLNRYACSNEIDYSTSNVNGIGTFCHEFGHVLGLPDLYATAYTGAYTPDCYSIMDLGSYNNNGRTPPVYSSYERYALEWLKPIELTKDSRITLMPLTRSNTAYKINASTSKPTEYYLLECRKMEDWDAFIGGHGMLVWHIDFNKQQWTNNNVNNNASHQYVDLIEADNKQSRETMSGDPYPGTANIFELTSKSRPALTNWAGNSVGFDLVEITENPDGIISLFADKIDSQDEVEIIPLPKLKLTDLTTNSIKVEWQPIDGAISYYISVHPVYGFLTSTIDEYVGDYCLFNLGDATSINIENLDSETTYGIDVYACTGTNMSEASSIYLTTMSETFTSVLPTLTIDNITPDKADAQWSAIADADKYKLTVAKRTYGESELASVTFDGKISSDGNEWETSGLYEKGEGYFGESAPSLRMSQQYSFVSTPYFEDEIKTISFWTKTLRNNAKMAITVIGDDGYGNMQTIDVLDESNFNTDGKRISVDIPENIRRVVLYYTFCYKGLAFFIDDLQVDFRGKPNDIAIAGYDNFETTSTSAKIENLERNTEYVAYLKAFAADGSETKLSHTIRFKTPETDAVESIKNNAINLLKLIGGIVTMNDSESIFSVYSAEGRCIAANCKGSYNLPSKGLYIIKTTDKAIKVIW